MGVDLAGVKRVIAAGRKADPKKCISVGFQQRYGPVYLEAYKRIQAGADRDAGQRARLLDRRRPVHPPPLPRPEGREAAQLVLLQGLLRRLHRRAGLPQLRRPALVPGRAAHPRRRHGRHQGAHLHGDHGPPDALLRVPQRHPRELRGQPDQPAGFSKVGEEFTGTKGVIATSRARMVHIKGPERHRDAWIPSATSPWTASRASSTRIQTRQRGERRRALAPSARCSRFSAARRFTEKREATWKGEFGAI